MKRFSLSYRILLTVLSVLCCMGALIVVPQGEETKFGVANSFESGEYMIVMSGIIPTGMSNGDYYVSAEEAQNPGFLFASFDRNNPSGATYWVITRISDTECTIQNPGKGDHGYLNITANTLQYGEKMNLNYSFSAGKCKFFAVVDGTTYYIRFTNSNSNESRFHAGTTDNSNQFYLYGELAPEPEPEYETSDQADASLPAEKPLLTIACISDLHSDYGLQGKSPYIRTSVIKALRRIQSENADMLLVGGDNTSDNGGVSGTGGWSADIFRQVIASYKEVTEGATESGRTLWACGNHDHQAGEDEGYDSYAAYEQLMLDSCGEPLAIYRQKDDPSVVDQQYPEHIMGIHYRIEQFDFIIVNPPYAQTLTYSGGTMDWLESRLADIGEEKTTFVVSHYPFDDGRGISTPSYGLSGDNYDALFSVLEQYPNVVYLYGHNHGGADSVYIHEDTFERINSYSSDGRVIHNRYAIPTSFITSFMGSMSYYQNSFNPAALGDTDPAVVQALMIYVYGDRIVFQMKNYGSALSNVTPTAWTVMRDISATVDTEDPDESVTDSTPESTEITPDTLIDTVPETIAGTESESWRETPIETIPESIVQTEMETENATHKGCSSIVGAVAVVIPVLLAAFCAWRKKDTKNDI